MPALPSRLVAEFESKVAQNELVSSHDIHLSRLSGMAPADIDVLCDFTREEGLLLISVLRVISRADMRRSRCRLRISPILLPDW